MARNKHFRVCQETEIKRYKSTLKLKNWIEISWFMFTPIYFINVPTDHIHKLVIWPIWCLHLPFGSYCDIQDHNLEWSGDDYQCLQDSLPCHWGPMTGDRHYRNHPSHNVIAWPRLKPELSDVQAGVLSTRLQREFEGSSKNTLGY